MGNIKAERKSKGLCPYCGNILDRSGYCCESCKEYHNTWNKNYVLKKLENGQCSSCGKELDREGWFCKACAKRLNNRATIRAAERRANNLCVQCGTPTDGGSYCNRCRDMRMKRYYKKKGI